MPYFRGPRNTGITNPPTEAEMKQSFRTTNSPKKEEPETTNRWAHVIRIPEDVDLRTLLYSFSGDLMTFNARRELPDFEHVSVDVFSYRYSAE
jgi:hypothetical protein